MRRLLLAIMVSVCMIPFSGCYDSREIDDMAYAMAIGIDKGKTGDLKMTLQFASPVKGGGGGDDEKNKGGSENIVYTTIESQTIFSGLNMINNYISKQVNMSHAKLIVFSEEIAKEGLYKYLNALVRSREFRGNIFVAISRSSAESFINEAVPRLQANSARVFEGYFKTYEYTGFSINSQLVELYLQQQSSAMQGVAALVGVNEYESSEDFTDQNSTYRQKAKELPMEGDYLAGDLPRIFDTKAEVVGMAVFDGSKMVGELDGEETLMYLLATGKYNYSYMSFRDPKSPNDFVVLNVKQSRKPVRKVDVSNDKPEIQLKIQLEADIISIQSGYNYENTKNTSILEEAAEAAVKKQMLEFLEKTSKEYKTDICGFGNEVKKKFLTWQEWSDYKWLGKYKDASFTVDLDLKVRRPGLIVRTVPAESTSGEGEQ